MELVYAFVTMFLGGLCAILVMLQCHRAAVELRRRSLRARLQRRREQVFSGIDTLQRMTYHEAVAGLSFDHDDHGSSAAAVAGKKDHATESPTASLLLPEAPPRPRAADANEKNLVPLGTMSGEDKRSDECTICLAEFCDADDMYVLLEFAAALLPLPLLPHQPTHRASRRYVLACSHMYHVDCLAEWLRRRNFCPLCKQQAIQPAAAPHAALPPPRPRRANWWPTGRRPPPLAEATRPGVVELARVVPSPGPVTTYL